MKKILSLLLTVVCIGTLSTNSLAAEVQTVETVDTNSISTMSETQGELIDSVSFTISRDGEVKFDSEVDAQSVSLEDVVTGTFNYYSNGLDSQKRPQYTVVLSIVSETNLKKSVLSTKAEGVSTWHDNTKNHSGKVGTNIRTYVYTSSNPPSNPYCYVKAKITISDGTTYYIPKYKLKL